MSEPTLREAAMVILRNHLDDAQVHPCDENDDAIRLRHCSPEIQALAAALAASPVAVEPVADSLTTITTPSGSNTWIAESAEEIAHFSLPEQGHTLRVYVPATQLHQAVERALLDLKFHPSASHVEPNYRDWFNKTIDAAIRERGTTK